MKLLLVKSALSLALTMSLALTDDVTGTDDVTALVQSGE